MSVGFDTNILVYAIDHDAAAKHGRSRELLRRAAFAPWETTFALQCLGEFAHVARRKYGLPLSDVREIVLRWSETFRVVAAAVEDLDDACRAVADHGLSFWDALLWATLRRGGVTHLVTEDLQDGRELGGLRFVDPFVPGNAALIDRLLPPLDLG